MRVRAPGSTANLGPGFDVLGLAVARYVWADDEGGGEPCGPDHIARIAYEAAGGKNELWFDFELEPGRGLGFSAAARAAGAVLAYLQAGYEIDAAQEMAYPIVAGIEGHGDNAAPSVFGGLHIIAGRHQHRVAAEMPGELVFWVPDRVTETDYSRTCLPSEVSREDAVFNLGRVALLTAAIYEGRLDLFRVATDDRLHQPQRLADCDQTCQAMEAALEAGAAGSWLSGSGPAVAALVSTEERTAVVEAFEKANPAEPSATHSLVADDAGAVVD